jgi:hypothetical protein
VVLVDDRYHVIYLVQDHIEEPLRRNIFLRHDGLVFACALLNVPSSKRPIFCAMWVNLELFEVLLRISYYLQSILLFQLTVMTKKAENPL